MWADRVKTGITNISVTNKCWGKTNIQRKQQRQNRTKQKLKGNYSFMTERGNYEYK